MAEKANEEQENNVQIHDDIGEELIEGQRESIEVELKHFKEQLEEAKKTKARYEMLWELDKEIYEIRLQDGAQEKKPEHKEFVYEDNPRFWELVKKKVEIEYEQEKVKAQATLERFDYQIKQLNESIESSEKKLNELGEKNE